MTSTESSDLRPLKLMIIYVISIETFESESTMHKHRLDYFYHLYNIQCWRTDQQASPAGSLVFFAWQLPDHFRTNKPKVERHQNTSLIITTFLSCRRSRMRIRPRNCLSAKTSKTRKFLKHSRIRR